MILQFRAFSAVNMDAEIDSDVFRVLSDDEEAERDIVGGDEENMPNSSLPNSKKVKIEGKT